MQKMFPFDDVIMIAVVVIVVHDGTLRCCRPEVTIPSDRLAGGDRNDGLHRFLDKG